MKRKESTSINTEIVWKKDGRTLSLTGKPVLEQSLYWPEPEGRRLKSVRNYYQRVQAQFRKRWERELYLHACMDRVEKEEKYHVFIPWQVKLMGEVTWQDEKIFSIAMMVQEEHGDHRILEYRWGDVWYWEDGSPVRLKDCIPGNRSRKGEILKSIAEYAEQLRNEGICFDPDGIQRLPEHILLDQFALTEGEMIFYCPQCTVAPAVEGVLELKVPRLEV